MRKCWKSGRAEGSDLRRRQLTSYWHRRCSKQPGLAKWIPCALSDCPCNRSFFGKFSICPVFWSRSAFLTCFAIRYSLLTLRVKNRRAFLREKCGGKSEGKHVLWSTHSRARSS